jgi:ribonuclease-3
MKNQVPGISYLFKDAALLEAALTHRSHSKSNNERLEFLGDAILNFVVASRLYELMPEYSEGDLSRLRSRVVRGETLAKIAAGLGLGDHLLLGEGELKSGGYLRHSILADALEAVFGAIYLDGGFEACASVIKEVCTEVINNLPDPEQLKARNSSKIQRQNFRNGCRPEGDHFRTTNWWQSRVQSMPSIFGCAFASPIPVTKLKRVVVVDVRPSSLPRPR